MANVDRPHPPGNYPVVVVGSGPGALQISYSFKKLGVEHAVISQDEKPGGMFRRFPIFQRLISWSKPYAPVARDDPGYEWFDWNSLQADEPEIRNLVPSFMDGSSYFPARSEMEQGLIAFAERTGLSIRYGCTWESTERAADGFMLTTSDGEYSCRVVVFAIGTTAPWKAHIAGIDQVPHYAEVKTPKDYAGRRVFVIGKRNSGFELADGLLPWASRIVLASPRPARLSVVTRSLVGARARYAQPYEDAVLGGGNLIVDASIERIERTGGSFLVHARGTGVHSDFVFEADDVIAATGFETPLRDLRALGVATLMQDRVPAQTPYWESVSVPGIYFAGNATQGATELQRNGALSSSAAVQGFRYNGQVLARYIAQKHFRVEVRRPRISNDEVVEHLLTEAARSGALWNQKGYLASLVTFDDDGGATDEGIVPLSHYVDSSGPDAVAVAIESDPDIHPTVFVRRRGRVDEHALDGHRLNEYRTPDHRIQLGSVLGGLASRPG
jgi:thioredoxin reductase